MNANLNSIENFNELVFENRNKQYGAYVLRQSQNDTITRSLIITCSFFGILVLLGIFLTNNKLPIPSTKKLIDPVFVTTIIDIPHPDVTKADPVKAKIDPVVKPNVNPPAPIPGPPQVSESEPTETSKPFTEPSTPGATTSAFSTTPGNNPDPGPVETGLTGNSSTPPEIVNVPDKMPEFKDLDKFVLDHLKFPAYAIERGVSGVVFVTFIVEKDGSVSDVKLKKGMDVECEREAIRVVKLMSGWVPGMYNGKPARVQCTLPIRFRLNK